MGNRLSRRPRPNIRGGFYCGRLHSTSSPSETSEDSTTSTELGRTSHRIASSQSAQDRLPLQPKPQIALKCDAEIKKPVPSERRALPAERQLASLEMREAVSPKAPTLPQPPVLKSTALNQGDESRAAAAAKTQNQSRSGELKPERKTFFSRQFWDSHARQVRRRLEGRRFPREEFRHFELLRFLNKGSFGSVYKVRLKRNNKIFAMKIQPKRTIVRKKLQKYACQEKRIFAAVNFKFIVKLFFAFKDNANLYLVMELFENGDMSSVIKKEKTLPEWRAKLYAGQLVLVLEYLHQAHIVFRDLKPANILIADDGYVKLTDFGVATVLYGATFTLCGTPPYMAPEIVKKDHYGAPVDWWALGIVAYEMLHGRVPFKTTENEGTALENLILTAPLELSDRLTGDAGDFVKKLLERDVSRRLGSLHRGAEEIMEHSWFSEIDFEKLYDKKYPIRVSKKMRDLEERGRHERILFDSRDHFPNDFLDF